MKNRFKTKEHEKLERAAIDAVPIPQPLVQDLAQTAGREAEVKVDKFPTVDAQIKEVAETALDNASQEAENAVALDSQAMAELTKESLNGKVESLEATLKEIKSGEMYSKLPQEMKGRIANVAWLTSQARNRLDSMEGPGQENVLLKASEDVSLAAFAMSTIPLAKQSPESEIAKFHKKINELRTMGIRERVATEEKNYAGLRTAATAASLQIRIGANSGSIAIARGYLKQKEKTRSKKENKKIRKSIALAVHLQEQAKKYLQAGKLGQADALLSKSNTLASATMLYMGAIGAKNSMRAPIKGKKQFEKIREDASAEVKKIGAALDGIAALDTAMDAKKLSGQAVQKYNEVREASESVRKNAAVAELLRFDVSCEGYVDKRLKRASESARKLIDAGRYENANELIGVALLYKQTYEKSAFKGAVGEDEKKTTLREKEKQSSKKFKYSLKSDKLRQARKKLRGLLDELVPPAEGTKQKPMSEDAYDRELASAKSLIKSVKKGLEHAQAARKDQQEKLLGLAAGQKKKPNSKATDHDIGLMVAYGFMGKEAEAEGVLDTGFGEHLDAERKIYIASLNLGETQQLVVEQDKLVVNKRGELEAAGKDLAKQSEKILTNVALKESFEELEEREKETGRIIVPQGVSDADNKALAINGMLTSTLESVMGQGAKMDSLHNATEELMKGKGGKETGFMGYNISNILEVQEEELKKSDEVLKEAGGIQAIGRSASTYLIAYRAGESRFWGGGKVTAQQDYVPRAMSKLYDATGYVKKGKWKEASCRYREAQGQFIEGFAVASERKYDDPLIENYKEKTQNAFDVLIGRKEGETKERKAAILALDATNLTVQTRYRGSQVFEGGLENIFVAFKDGGWLNLLGPRGMLAAQAYRATERSSDKGAPKTTKEKLELIGYVPYEERLARMEAETGKVLSKKTSMFEKRGALNNIRNDAAESLETYQIAQSAEDGLFTAASLIYQPIFITEMAFRDTLRHGADANTAVLALALATGKLGQFQKAASEWVKQGSKAVKEIESLSRLQKIAKHLKDPVELAHLAATSYLVVHGTMGAVGEFKYYSATGDMRHITAGMQSIAFQIPIITGFTAPMLRAGKPSPARGKNLLGKMREQRAAEEKFRKKLEEARPEEKKKLEKKLRERPEAPTGEKVKEVLGKREAPRRLEEREWGELATEKRRVVGPEAKARSLERAKEKIRKRLEKEGLEGKLIPKETAEKPASAKLRQNLETLGITDPAKIKAARQTIGAAALEARTNALLNTFKGRKELGRKVIEAEPELLTQSQVEFEKNIRGFKDTGKIIERMEKRMREHGISPRKGMEQDVRPYLDPNFKTNVALYISREQLGLMGLTPLGEYAPITSKTGSKVEAKAEVKEKTRGKRQNARFTKKYSVEWAEKTIAENRPAMNETAKNLRLRKLALNRIAREPAEVRTRLKEKIMRGTPEKLKDVMGMEWKVYVDGMVRGANEYSPVSETGFKAIQDRLAPETRGDINGFLRTAKGANAHGVPSDKGGHKRFTDVILKGEIHQGAWVGPLKKGPGVDRSTSSAFHGPFWIVLEGKAGARKGPITAEEHIAYVCPSEKYMVETSRAIKNAYSNGTLIRTEAVGALSKLMGAAEAKEAPATSFGSRAGRTVGAKEFWAERNALGEAEIVSFERFSGMKVKEVAAKPKENIVERIKKLSAEQERTGVFSIELATLKRQIAENPPLEKAVKEVGRTGRVLARVKRGKEIGAVGDIGGIKAGQIRKAEAAKAKAEKDLAEAEAAAKPVKESPGKERAGKFLRKLTAAKKRISELVQSEKSRKTHRREKPVQVLTPEGKMVEVPQEPAGNPTRRVQDTIFKSAIPDAGMRNAIGLERGRGLAKSAWAEVYKGEGEPAFRTPLEKDAYVAMKGKVQERFDQVVDYAWRDTVREKTKLIKRTKKPSRVNDAEMAVYLRTKRVFNTIWEANVKRKGMNKKSVEKMIKPQELAADYRGYLQRGAGMPKDMLAKVKEMGIETTITDRKFVTNVKNPSGTTVFGDLHGDHICPVTALKEVGFVIDTRPDLAVGDTSVAPKDRYIRNKEIPPGTQFIFLGDYIDRGPHSLYAVDFVQWLKAEVGALENGSHVHTIRGNHEAIFTRVFNKYKNKSTADVKGLIEQIETHRALENEGKVVEANKLLDSGRLGEFRKEGLWLERVGTETLLKEILDKYGTWKNAVVEMQKKGGLMHFIENTKAAVIVESGEGNHLYTHGGPVVKTAAREADGTLIRTTDGEIMYNEIKNVGDLEKHYKYFFENDLNSWAQNGPPTDSKMHDKYIQDARESSYAGDYSPKYGSYPEKEGGWKADSAKSKVGRDITTLANHLDFVRIDVGHDVEEKIRIMSSLDIGKGKRLTIFGHDSGLSEAYMTRFRNWQGGITYSTAWGVPGEKNIIITGRKNKVVEKPSDIKNFDSPIEMENPYTKAWEQTRGAEIAKAEEVTATVPTVRIPVPAVAPPTPKVAVPKKAPIPQKPAGIMPMHPTQPVGKRVAPGKAAKKGYQEMPENLEKWVDPETGLPWSKLVDYMENGKYSKKFTIPVEIKGETGEWLVTIEGASRVTGEEMYWYTVSSAPANIDYRPGQTTGAVVVQKGASLRGLITRNIRRSFKQTGSGKKSGVTVPLPVKQPGGKKAGGLDESAGKGAEGKAVPVDAKEVRNAFDGAERAEKLAEKASGRTKELGILIGDVAAAKREIIKTAEIKRLNAHAELENVLIKLEREGMKPISLDSLSSVERKVIRKNTTDVEGERVTYLSETQKRGKGVISLGNRRYSATKENLPQSHPATIVGNKLIVPKVLLPHAEGTMKTAPVGMILDTCYLLSLAKSGHPIKESIIRMKKKLPPGSEIIITNQVLDELNNMAGMRSRRTEEGKLLLTGAQWGKISELTADGVPPTITKVDFPATREELKTAGNELEKKSGKKKNRRVSEADLSIVSAINSFSDIFKRFVVRSVDSDIYALAGENATVIP